MMETIKLERRPTLCFSPSNRDFEASRRYREQDVEPHFVVLMKIDDR